MEDKLENLQQAKRFMEDLAKGVDPITLTEANIDTLHNEQVIDCFRFISDILEKKIHQTEAGTYQRTNFFITDEQLTQLKIHPQTRKVSELADEVNRVTSENGTKKLPASRINDWLEAEGYLCKSDLKSRNATEKGEQLGITSEYHVSNDGNEYYINFFTAQAQKFIFEHLHEIIALRNEKYSKETEKMEYIEFPDGFSIREFIQQYPDKCFIMSVGSCDPTANIGSYTSVLLFKDRSKVLKKSNILTSSAKECILAGIIDAALTIKLPKHSKRTHHSQCRKFP